MNAQELRRWLAKQGCTVTTHAGGGGHVMASIDGRSTQRPRHGSRREFGVSLVNKIKKSRSEMTLAYKLVITPDGSETLFVTCPALPELTTFGENMRDAVHHAVPAAEEVIAGYIAYDKPIPFGDASDRDLSVARLPLLSALKAELYEACRRAGVSRAELARRLGWHREQVDRVFRLRHASRLDQIEAASRAIGREVDIQVRAAA